MVLRLKQIGARPGTSARLRPHAGVPPRRSRSSRRGSRATRCTVLRATTSTACTCPARCARAAGAGRPVGRPRGTGRGRARARDEARVPFLAPARVPVEITRLATREKTQLDEVAAYLGSSGLAARPDLVFGVYRVPDHIDGGRSAGRGWSSGTSCARRLPAWRRRRPRARRGSTRRRPGSPRPGEPSVYDEDLALAYLTRAGIGPERTLGISRFIKVHQTGEESGSATASYVTGVHVWHPEGLGAGVVEQLTAARPLADGPVADVHVEVLNWAGIRKAVHPETTCALPARRRSRISRARRRSCCAPTSTSSGSTRPTPTRPRSRRTPRNLTASPARRA